MNAQTVDRLCAPGLPFVRAHPGQADEPSAALPESGRPLSARPSFRTDQRFANDEEEAELEILPEAEEGGGLDWFDSETEAESASAPRQPGAKQGPKAPATRRTRYSLFAWGVFFALGIFADLWHPSWLILLTIPLYEPIRRLRRAKDPAAALLAYPLFALFVYLCAGVMLDRWHPAWLLLLSIPLYRPALRRLLEGDGPDRS
ncbi:MAG TPA: hypothetical protein PKE04_03320 [Clostridia bacterium]|nr:hypothetical protein [Clostridia bacterium]